MKAVFGVCLECNDGVEVRLVSKAKKLCPYHYKMAARKRYFEKQKQKGKMGISPISDKQKLINQEDIKFYRTIWRDRKHVSEVGGDKLGDEMDVWFMSHIIPKKLYPHYRHNPENILLMTKAEHFIWDHGIPDGAKWEKVKALRDRLKEEYNQKERDGAW
jgi:hypothetical protein